MARNAAYWVEFERFAVDKRLTDILPKFEAIEMLSSVAIPLSWRKKERECAGTVTYSPGEVLHREWRPASQWEIEGWRNLSDQTLKDLGVFRKNGEFSVLIIEKIRDLPSAIRQRGRHIPARKVARIRKKFVLAGDAQILAQYAGRLTRLLEDFLKNQKPSPQLMEKAAQEIGQLSLLLEGSRSSLKRKTLDEIKLAQEGKFWQISVKTSQAISLLLEQRANDYEIAMKSIELAEKWRGLMVEIERRFRDCYRRLGQLGEKLQKYPDNLLPIASEALGIYKHLSEQVPNFNPYYERLQSSEFQRLSRVLEHARAGKAETVLNDIMEATAKLEAVALGEKPTQSELQRRGKELS